MIAFNRFDGRAMVFEVDGAGVTGEYRVPVSDRFFLDDEAEADALAEHVKAAEAGLVYELVHPEGRGKGRFAAIPRVRDERALPEHAADYIAKVDTKDVVDTKDEPDARAKAYAARKAELVAGK